MRVETINTDEINFIWDIIKRLEDFINEKCRPFLLKKFVQKFFDFPFCKKLPSFPKSTVMP